MTGPKEITLSNCPDCYSKAIVMENPVRGIWEVRCTKCPTFVWHNTKEETIAGWEKSVNKHMKGMICKRCGQKIDVPPEGSFTVEGMEKVAEYVQLLPDGSSPSIGGPVFYHATETECITVLRAKNDLLHEAFDWILDDEQRAKGKIWSGWPYNDGEDQWEFEAELRRRSGKSK